MGQALFCMKRTLPPVSIEDEISLPYPQQKMAFRPTRSPEVWSIIKRTPDLTTVLANEPVSLAAILLNRNLISYEAHYKVLLHIYTPTQKAAIMVESARKMIERDRLKFTELLEILSEVTYAQKVVQSLHSTYQSELT